MRGKPFVDELDALGVRRYEGFYLFFGQVYTITFMEWVTDLVQVLL